MWWWILTILLFLIGVVSSTLLFYSLRRVTQYEDLKLVDSSGHYESDDETGFFFEQLKDLQILLNGIFEEENLNG